VTEPPVHHPADPSSGSRRGKILDVLRSSSEPVAGTALARELGVSRQAIVQDVAILRASGVPMVATVRGYLLAPAAGVHANRLVVAIRHAAEQAQDELQAIVDVRVRVVDVVVDHPVYGEVRGPLLLDSPADVRAWAKATAETRAHLLSELTDGVHIHTLESSDPDRLRRAAAALAEHGYLREERRVVAGPRVVEPREAS
jgi:transcriptional regulator of NAD metabolism